MSYDLLTFIIFIALISTFLYIKRKNLVLQKLLFPVFYLLLYRTSFGLKFINKVTKKYAELVKLIGYACVGFSFIGMIYISYGIAAIMVRFFISPATTDTGFALVLPGTSIPGVGYLSFWYWIIPLVLLAIVHEFSHGIVARAHGLKVKSSGFAFLGVLVPLIPAAFVEPDEKELAKKQDIVQYSVFAAGPMSNLLFAFLLLICFPFVADMSGSTLAPFENRISYPVGFSVDVQNSSMPSGIAGMEGHMIISRYNNEPITDADDFIKDMSCKRPGEIISLGTDEKNYRIKSIEHPNRPGSAFVGVYNIKNERRIKPEYESIKAPFYWTKGLLKWLFLLNYFVGLINLFPIFITDGARILKIALEKIVSDKTRANKVWAFINVLFLFFILVGLISTYIKGVGLF